MTEQGSRRRSLSDVGRLCQVILIITLRIYDIFKRYFTQSFDCHCSRSRYVLAMKPSENGLVMDSKQFCHLALRGRFAKPCQSVAGFFLVHFMPPFVV